LRAERPDHIGGPVHCEVGPKCPSLGEERGEAA
jgi:hypothetical protein